ncbi:MAG: molybdenum cofactor guanylyltransferase [Gemmataceae bacterium]
MPSTIVTSCGGIILCGGESRRMGQPKAWLPVEGEPMLTRLVHRLNGLVASVVVVAAPGQSLPDTPSAIVVCDTVSGRGPLEGLAVGLNALQAQVPWAWVIATDMPHLCGEILQRLWLFTEQAQIVLPVVAGYRQPWAALYQTALAPQVRALLEAGETRPRVLLERCQVRECRIGEGEELSAWQNINTPKDYKKIKSNNS